MSREPRTLNREPTAIPAGGPRFEVRGSMFEVL
jgi:hypothetical protein